MMKSLTLVLLSAMALAACAPNSNNNVANTQGEQIVGGDKVERGSDVIRSTVALYDTKEHALCSGTLIAPDLVLTAGHCVGADPSKMIVFFSNEVKGAAKKDMRAVVAARVHKDYAPKKTYNTADIAIVKFAGGMAEGYAPAKFLADAYLLQNDAQVVVAGFGLNWTWVVKKGAGTLRTTTLKIADAKFSPTEISLDQSVKRGICSGDSGGPAYLRVNGQLYIWGVASRGDSLPLPLTPDCFIFSVFTRADAYGDWIADTMAALRK
ncbi:MAG: trypsin-like serine protease [Bdellovibrio sp.]|nr:trypsin-like serine protease [Bdellovibrio sp.]